MSLSEHVNEDVEFELNDAIADLEGRLKVKKAEEDLVALKREVERQESDRKMARWKRYGKQVMDFLKEFTQGEYVTRFFDLSGAYHLKAYQSQPDGVWREWWIYLHRDASVTFQQKDSDTPQDVRKDGSFYNKSGNHYLGGYAESVGGADKFIELIVKYTISSIDDYLRED